MEWAASEDGFIVSWTPPDGKPTTVQFAPTGRPGVYAGKAKAGWSMMDSMFGDEDPVNPLEGGALFWARTAEDGVYLYSLVDRRPRRLRDRPLRLSARPGIARRVDGAPHRATARTIRASSAW